MRTFGISALTLVGVLAVFLAGYYVGFNDGATYVLEVLREALGAEQGTAI